MKFTTTALAGILLAQPPAQYDDRIVLAAAAARKVERRRSFSLLAETEKIRSNRRLRTLLQRGGSNRGAHDGGRSASSLLSRRLEERKNKKHLRNNKNIKNNNKPCDPSSVDPDVGILSCGGKGSFCQPNENSFLGGTCVQAPHPPTSFSRFKKERSSSALPVDGGGILKNQDRPSLLDEAIVATGTTTECDPSADVGILAAVVSCGGVDEHCVPNPASSLGGYCQSASVNTNEAGSKQEDTDDAAAASGRRQLVWLLDEGGMCNPEHPNYMYYDCDCSGYDNVTGTGSVTCIGRETSLGLRYSGCKDLYVQRNIVYNFENFTRPSYNYCLSTTRVPPGVSTPSQSFCFSENFDDRTCEMRFDDELCNSCGVTVFPYGYGYSRYYTYIDFDCTNVEGGSYGNASSLTLLPIIQECYEPIEYPVQCELCPGENQGINYLYQETLDRTLINVSGYGTISCWYLAGLSYYYMSITPDACPALVASIDGQATTSGGGGCCSPICDICGEGVPLDLNSVANFSDFGEVPCFYLEGLLADPTECAAAKPLLVNECCSGGSPPSPTAGPTGANGDNASTPPPTSSSSKGGVHSTASTEWHVFLIMLIGGSVGALVEFFAIY